MNRALPQADPVVSDPTHLQNLNRYSYVLNNPFAYTDPTGFWGHKEQGYLRTAVAAAISVYTAGTCAGAAWGAFGEGVTAGQAVAAGAIGGFTSGAVASGTAKGALLGAFTGALGGGILQTSLAGTWGGIAVNATASGITSELNGGRFGSGFLSAGRSAVLAPHMETGNSFQDGLSAAVMGGTISAMTGGKFANGAVTASFSYAFRRIASNAAENRVRDQRMAAAAYGDPQFWMAWEPPALPQGFVDFAVGAGDGVVKVLSLGFGDLAATRDALGIDGGVDQTSMSYNGGFVGGAAVGLLAGGGAFNITLRPTMLYHFASLEGAAAIRSAGFIAESNGLYGTGVYATAFNSSVWASVSGAASTEAVLSFSTVGLRVTPTFFPGTYRVLGAVPW